jgi:aconitate hydratase
VSFEINPGSTQALLNVAEAGGVNSLILAGARIHQSGCLGCIGMGQAPATGTVSLRTFPRNFPGRSGTYPDQVYLCSPETAVAAAIFGEITDPRKLGEYPVVKDPVRYITNDENLVFPPEDSFGVEIVMGPNIKPFPQFDPLDDTIQGQVLLKVEDNITTDHIMPAGSKILPLRSNIEAISEFVFSRIDDDFARRAKESGGGLIVGGDNYGQGSSREHAAIAPRFLGIRAKLAKSFARIHKANLINFGILPLTFQNPDDYGQVRQGDQIRMESVKHTVESGGDTIVAELVRTGAKMPLKLDVTPRERDILVKGGLINTVAART